MLLPASGPWASDHSFGAWKARISVRSWGSNRRGRGGSGEASGQSWAEQARASGTEVGEARFAAGPLVLPCLGLNSGSSGPALAAERLPSLGFSCLLSEHPDPHLSPHMPRLQAHQEMEGRKEGAGSSLRLEGWERTPWKAQKEECSPSHHVLFLLPLMLSPLVCFPQNSCGMIYLVFVSGSWHRAPNTLGVS